MGEYVMGKKIYERLVWRTLRNLSIKAVGYFVGQCEFKYFEGFIFILLVPCLDSEKLQGPQKAIIKLDERSYDFSYAFGSHASSNFPIPFFPVRIS